jgi:hypothetical protein
MPNDKPRALHVQYPFHAAPPPDCLQKQHSFFACVYRFSTTRKQLSTDSVNEEKKCLVKSGKVKEFHSTKKSQPLSEKSQPLFEKTHVTFLKNSREIF